MRRLGTRRKGAISIAFVASSALLLAGQAPAELFRCKRPDGKTVFTDQKSLCPQAEEYQPSGRVQGVDPSAASRRPAARAPARRDRRAGMRESADATQAERWKQKKRAKEEELLEIEARRGYMREFVTMCNRGGTVLTRDEAGIKRQVSCTRIRKEFAGLDAREASIRDYLQNGLRDECRKAGCLPGWIR